MIIADMKRQQEYVSGEIGKFFGVFKIDDVSIVRSIAEDKGIFYGVDMVWPLERISDKVTVKIDVPPEK